MKEKILAYLLEHGDQYISGEVLRREFGVSRTAIWKHIKALKEEGYTIKSVPNRGYQLIPDRDRLLSYELERALGLPVEVHESLDSTNNYLKRNAGEDPDERMALSQEQKQGRGRLGRNWDSPKGQGLFFSLRLRPRLTMEESFKVTGIAAAAVAEAMEAVTGVSATIKWPNDILVGGKKVAGILTEVSGEPEGINYIIVGIGINVNNREFPGELKALATSLYLEKGEVLSRRELLVAVVNQFFSFYRSFLAEKSLGAVRGILEDRSAILGKEVTILRGGEKKTGKALEITEEGYLKVAYPGGAVEILSSGEVSVRSPRGYR